MTKSASSRVFSIVFCVSTLIACTEPGEMTGIGAATGGVVGAGLGAIVGNQTGNAGSGLAIGALAGAGAGAAVGNVLEAQDQAIRQQDEAIERQEQVIRAQRGELDELRRLGQDSVRFRGKTPTRSLSANTRGNPSAYGGGQEGLVLKNLPSKPSAPRNLPAQVAPAPGAFAGRAAPAVAPFESVKFRDVPKKSAPPVAREVDPIDSEDMTGAAVVGEPDNSDAGQGAIIERDVTASESGSQVAPPAEEAPVASANTKQTPDCLSAESEYQQAAGKSENPDKLFHIRRALRLCPDESRFHASLGDIYTALGRGSDAKFEYQEALRLSPGDTELKRKVEALPGEAAAEQY